MLIREDFVNLDTETRYGGSDWYEPFTDDLGRLYRSLRSEYGRCVSKVYRDSPDGPPVAIGWVFHKRVEYDDAHRLPKGRRTYLREVWVTIADRVEVPAPVVEYHEIG